MIAIPGRELMGRVLLVFVICALGAQCLAQTDPSAAQPTANGPVNSTSEPDQSNAAPATNATTDSTSATAMTTPAIVGGMGSSLAFTSETERSNYLRGGASVTAAYEDNVLSSVSNAGSDVTYTIGPFVSLNLSRKRYQLDFSYSPGFTFYQKNSSLNQTSQAAAVNFSYRLSPHVTFTAQDSLAKSSGLFGPVAFSGLDVVPNPIQSPNLTLIAPVSDTLVNSATVGLTYQFGINDMVGVTGDSSILRFLSKSQSQGLFDSTGEGAGAYYSHRFANRNYLGVNYQFDRLLADTTSLLLGTTEQETRTHSIYGFYTLYIKPTFSVTAFGGPQYSDTFGGTIVPQTMWSPSGGGSVSWQGKETSFAASFSRRITDGGGLPGAVRANIADASFRAQLTKTITGAVAANYATNAVLDPTFVGGFGGGLNGHSVSESVTVGRTFGEHLSASAGYSHLHQSYANIATFNTVPNVNTVFVSLSYYFERPLGR